MNNFHFTTNLSTQLRNLSGLAKARGITTVPHVCWDDVVKAHGSNTAERLLRCHKRIVKQLGHSIGEYIPRDDRHGRIAWTYSHYKALVKEDDARQKARIKSIIDRIRKTEKPVA